MHLKNIYNAHFFYFLLSLSSFVIINRYIKYEIKNIFLNIIMLKIIKNINKYIYYYYIYIIIYIMLKF